jgi:hypothetical protein
MISRSLTDLFASNEQLVLENCVLCLKNIETEKLETILKAKFCVVKMQGKMIFFWSHSYKWNLAVKGPN